MTTKEQITENIKRLEKTISLNCWNKGYVRNCQNEIESYKQKLKSL
jgi:septation ring formation regulator EzrA